MAGAVLQFAHRESGANSGAVTFAAAPTNGNRLVAMCAHFTNGPSAGAGWTLDTNVNGSDYGIAIAIKAAGVGESTSQTPFTGNGSGYIACWEISGLTGTWATDKQQVKDAVDVALTGGTTYSTASVNTTANDTGILGLIGADALPPGSGGPTQTAGPTLTGGIAPVTDVSTIQTDGTNRNSAFRAFHDYFATSGTAAQYTPTFLVTESKGQYVLLAINGWASPAKPRVQIIKV